MNANFLKERNTLFRSGFFTKTTWETRCSKKGVLISRCDNVNIEIKARTMSMVKEKQAIALESLESSLVDSFALRENELKYSMEIV